MHSTGMTKAVDRVYGLESFLWQSDGEVFFAESIDTMPGKFLPALIDKEALLVTWFWGETVVSDIELEELRSFDLELYESVAVTLSEDSECFLLRVEVIEVEYCDFTGPSSRVIEQMQECVIANAFMTF